MVVSNGGGGYETDFGTLQQCLVAAGPGPYHEGVGVTDVIGTYVLSGYIGYLRVRLQYTAEEWYMCIANYFHSVTCLCLAKIEVYIKVQFREPQKSPAAGPDFLS